MFWQNKYKVGDKLLYNGVPVTVTREAHIEEGYSYCCEVLDVYMQVSPDDNPLSFIEVSPDHEHLIKRDCTPITL